MGKDLRVDPAEVRMAADHVDVAADGLRTDHGAAQERIGTAQAGWIGTSGEALSKVAAKWEDDSTKHYNELIGHVEGFKSAAAQYVGTDHQEATEIENAGPDLGL
jgi:WXG100 family type VII secretion target